MKKITLTELRKIVRKIIAEKKGGSSRDDEPDAYIEIPNVSVHAESVDETVKRFVAFVKKVGAKYNIDFKGSNALDGAGGYSEEYDSLSATGARADLEAFARELDEKLMGGAQSIDDEDSFVNCVEDL